LCNLPPACGANINNRQQWSSNSKTVAILPILRTPGMLILFVGRAWPLEHQPPAAMPKIRILSDRVANQIAAGEVIERPAAVIKELVENALDAGATRIEVEFGHGGRSLLRVEDNGCGMSKDEALLALERHATSKIVEADDLNRLTSYGFRGEALPSVASVSRFTLQTREVGSDAGTEVFVNGGKLVHVRACGRPAGTRIEVAQLFHPVPARRKFLKSDQTEAAHIIQCVRLYALACARVSFTLIEEGRVLFRSPQCATLAERVSEIFGHQLAAELLPLQASEEGMELSGLICRPGTGRATRHEMITFVNGRPVDSRTLNYALIESYHDSVPKGRYPIAFLFLELDPASVDVNVHPAKREVRFRSEPQVRSFVIRSVLERLRALVTHSAPSPVPAPCPVPKPAGETVSATPPAQPSSPVRSEPQARHPALSSSSVALGTGSAATRSQGTPLSPQPAPPLVAPIAPSSPTSAPAPQSSSTSAWRYLGLAHGSYIVFETPSGLVLLDRRAALERIWYEQLLADYGRGSVQSQRLLLPLPVELDAVGSAMLLDRLSFLTAHGLEVAQFGRNFFRIEAIPDWLSPNGAEAFLRDLLGALREGRLHDKDARVADEQFARLAAAKANRLPPSVNPAEMGDLLRQLFACSMPLTSPSGRPTLQEWTLSELSRRFQGRA